MKFRKLEKLNHGRFRNFAWGPNLYPFGDGLNVLFGWNGSGKTTFSRFVQSIEKQRLDRATTFRLQLEAGTLSELDDPGQVSSKLRVFNDDYVNTTLRGSLNIPYIFFAGKDAVDFAEEETRLDEKRSALAATVLPTKHDDIAREVATLIRSVTGINGYKKELTGGATYSSYDKLDFEKRFKNIREKIGNKELTSHSDLVRSDINELKTQLANTDRLGKADGDIAAAAQWVLNNIEPINAVLQKQPIQEQSARIEALGQPGVNWIKQGVTLHFDSTPRREKCLFCDSVISNAEELLRHFSQEVLDTANAIDAFHRQIEGQTATLAHIQFPTASQKAGTELLRSTFDALTSALREKRNSIADTHKAVAVDISLVRDLTATSDVNLTSTAYAVETHFVAQQYKAYEGELIALEGAQQDKKALEDEVKVLDDQVRTLKQKAKNTHEPASALNTLFRVVFPNRTIEITDSDEGTGYVLKRDGSQCPFVSLSEGEKNFIALAYFIYSINDAQNKLADDGVVLIDDPVSSLDKQAIFQIFSIIVNEIKKHAGRQYFLLTHNLDFLGHIKASFNEAIKRKDVPLFCFTATSGGCVIEKIPALLRDHRSDYYYVFTVLFRFKDQCSLEDSYLVVNLLRRWLETFLEFKFSTSGDLQSTLEGAYGEAKRQTAKWDSPFSANHLEMYRFINHGSHGFPDTEATDDSVLVNANQRIQEAFALVNILDGLHYKKLKATVGA